MHEITLRVQYYDTDCMGIVHHANYVRYFEMGRTQLMRDLGAPYAELERQGVQMPIIAVSCQYLSPACYDELLTVRTRISGAVSARIRFAYEIVNEAGKLLCTGTTDLAFMHAATRRPCRPPQLLLEKIKQLKNTTAP